MKKMLLLIIAILYSSFIFSQQDEPDHINYFPNYHPMIVHFPIVLLIVATFMQAGFFFFKSIAYNYSITIITVVGFTTGLLAATVFHAHAADNVVRRQSKYLKNMKNLRHNNVPKNAAQWHSCNECRNLISAFILSQQFNQIKVYA